MDEREYERMASVEASHWWYRSTRALLQQLTARHAFTANGTWLDAGCGTGATGAWLQSDHKVVALDFSTHGLRLYRSNHPRAVGAVAGDLVHLPIRATSVDGVLCVTVLYHASIADPASTVRQLAQTLRPGGCLILMEPGVRHLRRAHDRGTAGARRFARADLAQLVTGAGLECVRSTGAYTFLVPVAALDAVVHSRRSRSDLERSPGLLDRVFALMARAERRWLERRDLPWGLSVIAIGRRPNETATLVPN